MQQPRLFIDHALITGEAVSLPEKAAHYARQVLRLAKDAELVLFNGCGGEYSARLTSVSKASVVAEIGAFEPTNRGGGMPISLGLCIAKRDAMDTAIQLATELGVSEIQPLRSSRVSVARQAIEKRGPHWQQIIYSACEQCGLNLPPRLLATDSLENWLENRTTVLNLIADPGGEANALSQHAAPASISVVIGPEGGFSPAEIQAAMAQAFVRIGLGPRVLRAAHAPAVMLGLLQARFGDLADHTGSAGD